MRLDDFKHEIAAGGAYLVRDQSRTGVPWSAIYSWTINARIFVVDALVLARTPMLIRKSRGAIGLDVIVSVLSTVSTLTRWKLLWTGQGSKQAQSSCVTEFDHDHSIWYRCSTDYYLLPRMIKPADVLARAGIDRGVYAHLRDFPSGPRVCAAVAGSKFGHSFPARADFEND